MWVVYVGYVESFGADVIMTKVGREFYMLAEEEELDTGKFKQYTILAPSEFLLCYTVPLIC
jgi:hypothetical protein